MKNKLPCELIQDLFPSYIDGLTSDVTNEMVEEHVEECRKCKNILEVMREPSPEPIDATEKKEIDFLKKNKTRNRKIVIGSIVASFFVILTVLFVRTFLVGSDIYNEMVTCEAEVQGKHLSVEGVVTSENLGISDIDFQEKDGVVSLSFKAVRRSIFYDSNGRFQSDFEAAQEITQVCIGDRIIWAQGEDISAITSGVYHTRHLYIGDVSKNGQTAMALNMHKYLGDYTNELQTAKEPYDWKFILEKESTISSDQRENKEMRMKSYGYILLAVIENLGQVSYEYSVNGEVCSLSVNRKEASEFAGRDIKECGRDILLLQKLIEKTGLDNYAYVADFYQQNAQNMEVVLKKTEKFS